MNYEHKSKINSSLIIISISVIAAVLYPLLSGEINQPSRIRNGVIIGFLGSGFIVLNEIWLRRMFLRKMKFLQLIIIKSIQYSLFFIVMIILVISFDRSSENQMSLIEYWNSSKFSDLLFKQDFSIMISYALSLTVLFILLYQTSKKMGQGVLINFILGRYHNAKKSVRVFMYLDLKNSTGIAEKLGDVKYHQFLNRFFYDITDSILLHNGKIYRYVGDEIIVSWNLKEGLENTNYLKTYYAAKAVILAKSAEYLNLYGFTPKFTAAFHVGEGVVGEIGEVKSEIAFIGSVTYETTAIEKHCSSAETDILVSKALMEMTELPIEFSQGKTHNVAVPEISDIEAVEIVLN